MVLWASDQRSCGPGTARLPLGPRPLGTPTCCDILQPEWVGKAQLPYVEGIFRPDERSLQELPEPATDHGSQAASLVGGFQHDLLVLHRQLPNGIVVSA